MSSCRRRKARKKEAVKEERREGKKKKRKPASLAPYTVHVALSRRIVSGGKGKPYLNCQLYCFHFGAARLDGAVPFLGIYREYRALMLHVAMLKDRLKKEVGAFLFSLLF